jgi:hypothetical protein
LPHVGKESQPTEPAEAYHFMLSARTNPGWQGTPRVPQTVHPFHGVGRYAQLRSFLAVALALCGLLVAAKGTGARVTEPKERAARQRASRWSPREAGVGDEVCGPNGTVMRSPG